ncbi:MAG: helix-turn-helix transcriptional regulator [Dyella sp.]|uniref:helix-turn-helix transcriptional regulator n=1 Tax=Dyella sp. TaxID=1869338 RepID=UPI003F7F199F
MNSNTLPETGFLRLPQIIGRRPTEEKLGIPALIPVSAGTWWAGVKAGRFPKPVKLSPRVTAWRVEDIRAWLDQQRPEEKAEAPLEDVLSDKGLADALGLHSVKDVAEAVSIQLLPSPDYIPSDSPGEWLWKRATVEPYLADDAAATIRGIFINSTGKRIPRNRRLNALQSELRNVIDQDREAMRTWMTASGPMKPMPEPRMDVRKKLGMQIAVLIMQVASEVERQPAM